MEENFRRRIEERYSDLLSEDTSTTLTVGGFDRKAHLAKLANLRRKVDPNIFRELYLSGKTAREIAVVFGINPGSVTVTAKNLGVYRPGQSIKPKSHVDVKQVVAFYENGRSTYEIANMLSCSQGYIYNIVKKSGVPRRKHGRLRSKVCKFPGCQRESQPFTLKGNPYIFGSWCHIHRKEILRRRARWYLRVKRQTPSHKFRVKDKLEFFNRKSSA